MCGCEHHWDVNAPCTCNCPEHAAVRAEMRILGMAVEEPEPRLEHGSLNAYTRHGCRCDDCRDFWNAYMRWYRAYKRGRRHGTCPSCTCELPEKPTRDSDGH